MPPSLADYDAVARRRPPASAGSPPPKVTLITVTLNSAAVLDRTITSVQQQTFPRIEHVVVDGGSSDDTARLLERRLRPQDFWLSEPDGGISDAMNKGVALSRAPLVQFIHSDDWLSPDQVALAVEALASSGASFVFGDLIFYEADKPVFRFSGDPDYERTIRRRMPNLNHPTVLARRTCFEQVSMFDPAYRCAMDYDWFLRLHLAGHRGQYDSRICGHMTHDGISNTMFHRTFREVRDISVSHGRAWLPALVEEYYHHAKTSLGRSVKSRARPVYNFARQRLNPSFRPFL